MKSLLIVIEEEYLSKGIVLALMNDFQSVHSTKNPFEALEILKKEKIDAVITELKFRTISEEKYFHKLNNLGNKNIKVIVLDESKKTLKKQILNKNVIYMQKPISIKEIIKSLKNNTKLMIN